jgi:hypothetical protein
MKDMEERYNEKIDELAQSIEDFKEQHNSKSQNTNTHPLDLTANE